MLPTRLLFTATFLLIQVSGLMAQSPQILNPGFESDSFNAAPGYASENGGSITAWSHTGSVGLNPTAGDASYANNGAIPEGGGVAFLRSNGAPATLSSNITGLIPGTRYTVRFRANCRDGQAGAPVASWSLNGGPSASFRADIPVGAANPYRIITGSFVASAATAQLVVKNDSGTADSTLLLDDFSVATDADASSGWSMRPWTDDASLGLDPARTLWVVDSGEMGSPIVGPGTFPIEPEVWGKLAQSGFRGTRDDQNEILSNYYADPVFPLGQSYYLAARCCYGYDPVSLTLTGLVAGRRYRVTFYGSSELYGPPSQPYTICDESGSFVLDQNLYGSGKSLRIERDFIARGQTHAFLIVQHLAADQSFHLNGVALQGYDSLVEVTPATINSIFVSQVLNAPATARTVAIRNPGTELLRVSSLAMEGPHGSNFRLSAGTLPADLPPGGEMPCTITYQPSNYGSHPSAFRVVVANPPGANIEITALPLKAFASESFDGWAQRLFGPDATTPAIAGPDADPDGDGLSNLLEHGLRMDPRVPGIFPPILPVPATAWNGKLSLRFTLPLPAKNHRLSTTLQHSSDLKVWTNVYKMGTLLTTGETSASAEMPNVFTVQRLSDSMQVDVTSDNPLMQARPGFWRLKVE
ncbi:hypothetical protein [Haloferula sp. BvORR071]|uniref:hypothetical protein n=1 Tax=Haloferula sp. BvORR071 TaxID=1396141 RepID=UPI0005599E5F|nr:hypothetical protein [Haloferula sp. BvORR071]